MARRESRGSAKPKHRWSSALAVFLSVLQSSSSVVAQGLYARGDATCDLAPSAADVVATVRGLGGNSLCDNDDCDRDGALASADARCAAGCVFAECPVPDHAPQVGAVIPDSAAAIVPLSSIRITGLSFGDDTRPKRVLIGGQPTQHAELIDDGVIEAVVPFGLPPGPTTLVVIDGEIAGAPIPITIAPSTAVGARDSLDGTFALVDDLTAAILALDLEDAFGSDAPLLRQQLTSFRSELAAHRATVAADPDLTAELEAAIDDAVDGSGLPELLREQIADAEALQAADAMGSGGQRQALIQTLVARAGGTVRVVGGVARAAGVGAAAVGTTAVSPVVITVVIIGGILTIAGSYWAGVAAARAEAEPVLVDIAYRDGNQVSRGFPTVGGKAYVTSGNPGSTPSLILATAFGEFTLPLVQAEESLLVYDIPDEVGVCGKATVRLQSSLGAATNQMPTFVQPLERSVGPGRVYPKQLVEVEVAGVAPCTPVGAFMLPGEYFKEQPTRVEGDDRILVSAPDAMPRSGYEVVTKVDGMPSQEPHTVAIVAAPTAVAACAASVLRLSPSSAATTACTLTINGEQLPTLDYNWISSRNTVATVTPNGDLAATVQAVATGTTQIRAVLFVEPEVVAQSNAVTITVTDAVPALSVACNPTSVVVAPGTPSTTNCTLSLTPAGAPLPQGSRITWVSSDTQTATASDSNASATIVTGRRPGAADISARLVAGSALLAESNKVGVTVGDTTPPVVTLSTTSPSSINAGDSIEVRVQAEDNVQVNRIILETAGDAVSGISPAAELPCVPQESCSHRFTVNTKTSGFLNTIVGVSARAFDGRGNEGSAASSLTFTVGDDTECPQITIQSPQNGGRVRAGDTVQVSVLVTDNRPGDSGVRRVIVEATGPAVEAGPTPSDVTLPVTLPQATRLTTFTVKNDLTNITDRAITITANAADDAGNLCAQPQTITVMAGGAPQIASVGPNPVNAGATVTIIGQAFGETQESGSVSIGGAAAAVQSWSNTQIVAQVPANASGNVDVVVVVGGEASNAVPLQVLGTGDVQVTLSWSDVNDLDLHVTDPTGATINYVHETSPSGGRLDVDANAGCGTVSAAPRENIFWSGQAPAGLYQVTVVYFQSCPSGMLPRQSTGVSVTVKIGGQFMTLIENGTVGPGGTLQASFTR